ncbi:MAG: hypothetical protein OER21_01170 [Gemmatimonadota bacterium]|nr:hypothetical protein [Gemmatimonadota bacterium]
MLRPILAVAAVGLAGVAIWQLLWFLVLPLLAGVLGFAMLALKLILVALILWAAWRLVRRVVREPA